MTGTFSAHKMDTMDGNPRHVCPAELLDGFGNKMVKKLWRVNGLMLFSSILMGIVVTIGVFAPRARRSPLIGFLFLGASTLPVVYTVAATADDGRYFMGDGYRETRVLAAKCEQGMHIILVACWTAVVIIIDCNKSIVGVADARERRTVQPPSELSIRAILAVYIIILTIGPKAVVSVFYTNFKGSHLGNLLFRINFCLAMCLPLSKMFTKYIAFSLVQRRLTFTFGRNPRAIVRYMAQLRESRNTTLIKGERTPKLIVEVPEKYYKLVEQPCGFSLDMCMSRLKKINERKVVKLDRIWEQPDDDIFLKREHKDLCFSFALFRLLRCRFAKYTVSEAGFTEAQFFFRKEYLCGNNHHDRVFQVVADELSFINSYYNSSLPIYSTYGSVFVPYTLLSLGCYLTLIVFISIALSHLGGNEQQVYCSVWCLGQTTQQNGHNSRTDLGFGNIYFDVVPVLLALAALLLSEVKDLVFYLCSNWTKVALICYCIKRTTSPAMKKCIAFLVNRCRSNIVNSWDDKMGQCSILVHRRWWKPNWHFLWCLFGFPNQKPMKELSAVKKSIFEALQKDLTIEQEGAVKHIRRPSPPVPGTDDCNSVADTILAWHIATSLFELNDQEQPADPERSTENPPLQSSDSDSKIVATQLSRYCVYLVACRPELLPDEDEWCKKLYGDVLRHADRVLRAAGPGAGFQQLVELLKAETDNNGSTVLKNGAGLAHQMVTSNIVWKQLAVFWAKMILYIATSENLEGHAETIACGGEMVTLLWALLAHAGIVDRPVDAAADTNTVAAADALNTSGEEVSSTAGDLNV